MNAPQPDRVVVDPRAFAASTFALLAEDPMRYRCFGLYWYFVKDLLRRFYDRHNLYFLAGDYVDQSVVDLMPDLGPEDMLEAAAEEYQQNAAFRPGSNRVEDNDGETFMLMDPDVEG